jgi:hypothetical protein
MNQAPATLDNPISSKNSTDIIIGAILAKFVEGAWFLIVAAFSLPIGVLTYLLISAYIAQIDITNLERAGNSMQKPLLESLAQVRIAENALQACAAANCGKEAANQASLISASLLNVSDQNELHATELKTNRQDLAKKNREELAVENLKKRWRELADTRADLSNPANRVELTLGYERLAQHIKWLISYVGDSSHLILDPDLDSYYLVDVTLLDMPDTLERIARTAALGNQLIAGPGAVAEQALLGSEIVRLQESVDRIAASNESAIDGHDNYKGRIGNLGQKLRPALFRYQSSTGAYLETLKAIGTNSSQVSAAALAMQAAGLQKASLEYWNSAASDLNFLLDARNIQFEARGWYAFVFSSSFVILAGIFVMILSRSTTKPMYKLLRNLAKSTTLPGISAERILEAVQTLTPDPGVPPISAKDAHQSVLELARHIAGYSSEQDRADHKSFDPHIR